MRLARYAATAALLLLPLSACSQEDGTDGPEEPDPTTADPPAALEWQETGESAEQTVVVGREWRAVVAPDGAEAILSGDGEPVRVAAGRGYRVGQVLMSPDHAVVVSQDERERRPAKGVVVDLQTGEQRPSPGPEPAAGGSWALHEDELRYPTFRDRRYCLAAAHLPSSESQVDWCAEPRHGWSRATQSRWGTALMGFDDARPVSCRTLVVLTDGTPVPVTGVPECRGWEAVATEDGAVWSAVTDENNVTEGRVAATVGDEVLDLGTGSTGTLTPCGGSVFFARPAGDGPAALVRVLPDGSATTVWEAPGEGPGFLAAPACAGDVLTLTYLGEDGDQQLWAIID